MDAWEIIVLVSSTVNTVFIIALIILLCVLVAGLIKLSNKVNDVTDQVQEAVKTVGEYVKKPSKLMALSRFLQTVAEMPFMAKAGKKSPKQKEEEE